MMEKLDKKSILIIAVLLINIIFITVPYTMKNMNIENKIKQAKMGEKKIEKQDFYSVYDDFNAVLDELKISCDSKKLDINRDGAYITIILKTNMNIVANMLTYINKKIPDMSVSEANINTKQMSKIVFFVGNSND